MIANDKPVSVSSLINEVKNLIEGEFRTVSVVGEVTNLSLSSTGHYYFTLSDKDSSLSGVMFKMDALRSSIRTLKDGDKVICAGPLNVYQKRGSFQIVAKVISKAGKGDLKEQFELLKKRLAADGLFDMAHKKAIPKLPKRIGIITAERGAALQDFLNIVHRRSVWMDVVVVPTLVQGEASASSIRKSLFNLIKYSLEAPEDKKIDVIVLARGGGSLEDLWSFNDEGLAWDIFNCPIPVISAIGHQVDFTICDYVADLRAETPSAAAEMLTEFQTSLLMKMSGLRRELLAFSRDILRVPKQRLEYLTPKKLLERLWQRVLNGQKRLARLDLKHRIPQLTRFYDYTMRVDEAQKSLLDIKKGLLREREQKVERLNLVLNALSPHAVLDRGYSYVTDEDGKVVSSMKQFKALSSDVSISLHLKGGIGKVKKVESK